MPANGADAVFAPPIMLKYLIDVTDNTLIRAFALTVLLLLALVNTRRGGRGFIGWGLLAGALAALAYAILKRNTGFMQREYYDLVLTDTALRLQILFLGMLWPCFASKQSATRQAGPFTKTVLALLIALTTAHLMPNLLLFPLDFDVGMDSVFNTEYFFRVLGYSTALSLLFLLGLGLYTLTCGLPRPLQAGLAGLVMLVLMGKELLEVSQALVARGVLPRGFTKPVIFWLNHEGWFAYTLLATAAVLAVGTALCARAEPLRGANPAEIRKQRAGHRRVYRFGTCALVCGLCVILTITAARAYANRGVEISPAQDTTAENGRVLLPLSLVGDGNLHRFQHTIPSGVTVRFIVIRKSETAYGVGLDACEICGPTGYYQRKDQVVCRLCDVVMNKSTIGFPGGCNPIPLAFALEGGNMVIRVEDLEKVGGGVFR